MALNPQKRGTFTHHILSYLESRFLERLEADLHLTKFGVKRSLARRSGNTIKYNRYANLTGTTTALTEGVTPTGLSLSDAQVTLTLDQYGQFVTLTDEFQLVSITDESEEVADLLAYDAAISMDTLSRNELDANGTQNYVTPATNSSKANVESNTTEIKASDVIRMNMIMKNSNVPAFEDGYWKFIIHPRMEFDLMSESSSPFVTLQANTNNEVQERGLIGRMYNFKIYTSTNVRADATSTHVYGNIALGRKAYVTGDIETGGLRMIFKGLGAAGTEDPLEQRQTLGWKSWFGVKILEAARVQVLWAYNNE